MKKTDNSNKNKLYELKNQAIGINMLSLDSKDALKKMNSYGKTHSFLVIKFFGSSSCPPCKQLKKLLTEDNGNFWNIFIKKNIVRKTFVSIINQLGGNIATTDSYVFEYMNQITCQEEIRQALKNFHSEDILNLFDQYLVFSLLYFDVSELSGYEEFRNYSLEGIPALIGTIVHQNENAIVDTYLTESIGYKGETYVEECFENVIKLGLCKFFNNNFLSVLNNGLSDL